MSSESSNLINQARSRGRSFRVAGFALFVLFAGVSCTPSKNIPVCAISCTGSSKEASWTVFNDSTLNQLMDRLKKDNLQLRSVKTDWNADHPGRIKQTLGGTKADIDLAEKIGKLQLTLQSQLAKSYFQLRFVDKDMEFLEEELESRIENLDAAKKRFENGQTSNFDVVRAEADLAATRAGLARMNVPRDKLEIAIGILVGANPGCFHIESSDLTPCLPVLKEDVPISVLKNRPDVSAAVARLKLANSRIGLERCHFFPSNNLIGNNEHCRISCSNFMEWSCRTFTVCADTADCASLRGSDKGRKLAAQMKALVDYQKTMLTALSEVDNALAELTALCAERDAHRLAVNAAEEAVKLNKTRLAEGDISSTEMVSSELMLLSAKRRQVQIRGQQYAATVDLIEALGGRCVNSHFSEL